MKDYVIRFDKNENILTKTIRILSVACALICLIYAIVSKVYYPLWLLPMIYSLGLLLLGNNNVVMFAPGVVTLNVVMFCRYALLPLVIYLTGELSRLAKQYEYVKSAVFIMAFELVGILLTLYVTGKRQKNKRELIFFKGDEEGYRDLRHGNIVCMLLIVLLLIMAIRYPYLIGGINLLLQGYLENAQDISGVSGVIGIVWKAGTIWLFVYVLSWLKKKDNQGKCSVISLVLVSLSFLVVSFIGQVTISRWYTVVSFIAVYFCIIKLFPEKKRKFNMWLIAPMFLGLLVTSVYKNTDFLVKDNGFWRSMLELFDTTLLDAYFAGPVGVNNALYVKEYYSANFFSIFFDLIRNMPIVHHYVDLSASTVKIYAAYMGRGDQIIPLVGQSVIYFGYLFAPLLSVGAIAVLRYFDYLYLKSKSFMIYMYSFIAAWFGLAIILNLTICVSWIYVTIIPAMLVIRFTEMIKFKEYKRHLK